MTLQEISNTGVMELLSIVGLSNVRVLAKPCFKDLRHVLTLLPVDGYRNGVSA